MDTLLYEYDQLGRRTKLTNALNKVWDTAYTEVDQAQRSTLTYPGINGAASYNLVRDFDRIGRLKQVDYLLDVQPALALVLRQTSNSSIHGVSTDHYVHGVSGIHAVDDGSTWEWYMQDGLGSIRNDGMSYDPYGNPDGELRGWLSFLRCR